MYPRSTTKRSVSPLLAVCALSKKFEEFGDHSLDILTLILDGVLDGVHNALLPFAMRAGAISGSGAEVGILKDSILPFPLGIVLLVVLGIRLRHR